MPRTAVAAMPDPPPPAPDLTQVRIRAKDLVIAGRLLIPGQLISLPLHDAEALHKAGDAAWTVQIRSLRDNLPCLGHVLARDEELEVDEQTALRLVAGGYATIVTPERLSPNCRIPPVIPRKPPPPPPDPYAGQARVKMILDRDLCAGGTAYDKGAATMPEHPAVLVLFCRRGKLAEGQKLSDDARAYLADLQREARS
jgi:hypothetical protein